MREHCFNEIFTSYANAAVKKEEKCIIGLPKCGIVLSHYYASGTSYGV